MLASPQFFSNEFLSPVTHIPVKEGRLGREEASMRVTAHVHTGLSGEKEVGLF